MGNGIFDKLKSLLQPWADLFGKRDESANNDVGKASDLKTAPEDNVPEKSLLKSERALRRAALFSDVEISGENENLQKIPQRSIGVSAKRYTAETARETFIEDMRRYENCDGTTFALPASDQMKFGYAGMTLDQQKEYFCWRTEVRAGKYSEVDKAYVRIHVQEILNGCGWKQPEDGLKQLVNLWTNYRNRFPEMDEELFDWTFSFSQQHQIDFAPDEYADIPKETLPAVKDLLIERHRKDKPLKLSFPLVETMSTYPIRESKFYKDGNQKLIAEAMPRVIALADALSLKQGGKGIIQKYGPRTGRKQRYCVYKNAVHPEAGLWNEVTVKAYTASGSLREYITELIRHAENVLRGIYGFRGRLRVEKLDAQTAERIEEFLKREYGKEKNSENAAPEQVKVKLDFDSINALRIQSDAVRDALEVTDVQEEMPKQEIAAQTAETPKEPMGPNVSEDNGCFCVEKLSEPIRNLINVLSGDQRKVLREILVSDSVNDGITQIAEAAMTLPEIIIDEINDLAAVEIDDILIDAFGDVPCVLEQYDEELRGAVIRGG